MDYRRLNKLTVADHFPLPQIDDLLRDVGPGNQVFSSIDLTSGFWQLGLTERSMPLTAFSTPFGHYEFTRASMGLRNSPIAFSRMMHAVFHNLVGREVFVYLDDLLIVSETVEAHLAKLELVFQRLMDANLTINLEKSRFLQSHLEFLGHTLNHEGLTITNDRVKAIEDFRTPASVPDVRSFLGMIGFCRPFIEGFAKVAKPLTDLLKSSVTFGWGSDQEAAFTTLKRLITTSPILIYPDFNVQQTSKIRGVFSVQITNKPKL